MRIWNLFREIPSKPAAFLVTAIFGAFAGAIGWLLTGSAILSILLSCLTGAVVGETGVQSVDGIRGKGSIFGGLSGLVIPGILGFLALIKSFGASTVLSIMGIPAGLILLWFLARFLTRKNNERKYRLARDEEKETSREMAKIALEIETLTGKSEIAQGFMRAVALLTAYESDLGLRLLGAAKDDLERYQMLGSLISSTDNDQLRKRAEKEQKVIASTMRETVAKLTEEALATVETLQASEAERIVGERKPVLGTVAKDLDFYLAGIREVRMATEPIAQTDELSAQIEALNPAREVEVHEFPIAEDRKKLGRGN